MITLNIDKYMDYNLDVFAADSDRLGFVSEYDLLAGYMVVKVNTFSNETFTIPFHEITHIDPREVFVAKNVYEIRRLYSAPPPRDTAVEARIDPDTGEDVSLAITSEPSGYDGAPAVVEVAEIGKQAHHIAPGFEVYTSESEDVGVIKQYDRATGKMLVEWGGIRKHDFVVPVDLVAMVDREKRRVYLAVSSTDLERLSPGGIRG